MLMLCRTVGLALALAAATVASYHCPVHREIVPCTCRLQEPKLTTIVVACEEMESFARIVDVLHNKFTPQQDIALKVSHSQLDDLNGRTFRDLGMSLSNLNLNFDHLSYLNDSSFVGLEGVEYLSLSDNKLQEVPRAVLRRMPKLKTLDLGRDSIQTITNHDFQGLPTLMHLVMPANAIVHIESHALPTSIIRLHLGRNFIPDLNNSLRALTGLEWLFINSNELTTLHDQLPPTAPRLILIHSAHNHLMSLPTELRNYPMMDTLFFNNNAIQALNGVLQRARRLKRLHLTHNRLHTLAEDEFAESEVMDDLQLGHNQLQHVRGAFLHMKKLRTLNLTHNHLEEFSFQEIRGLQILKTVDLSNNRISRLIGQMENLVEQETRVEELHLEHNQLIALEGALLGIHGLRRLLLHDNLLQHIAPDDLIGLDDLRLLDISNNHLKTLEETSKTFLPRLENLIARNNYLTYLEDFHGLPALCRADLSYNRIHTLGHDLGSKTQCRGSGGLLIVTLYDNPVICELEFNSTAETMLRNFTLLQGDFSICPAAAPATPLPATTTQPPAGLPIDLKTLLRVRPQVLQLKYDPGFPETNETQPTEPSIQLVHQAPVSTPLTQHEQATEVVVPQVFNPPIIVRKDNGQNLTLVIPMENGVINKAHGADQYRKEDGSPPPTLEDRGVAAITNIEIVDIKPLPNDFPTKVVPAQAPQTTRSETDNL